MSAPKIVGPTVRALDADGSEFWLDANGLAWRADRSRVPELDSVPVDPAPLDRAEVVGVLAALHLAAMRCREAYSIEPNAHRQRVGQVRNLSRANTVELVADRLGLRAEFHAAVREGGL